MRDARASSAVEDLARAVDALTLPKSRYLGRLTEPRWAEVPPLLQQLEEAIQRSGEVGAVAGSTGSRPPLDLAPVDLLRAITRGAYGWCALTGLRPRPAPEANLRQLAARARTLADTEYPTVSRLSDQVADWRAAVEQLLPEVRTTRDLPDLRCSRCRRKRTSEPQPDGRVLLAPSLCLVTRPMPSIVCRSCGHVYLGDKALRALAAWQGSERAGAA